MLHRVEQSLALSIMVSGRSQLIVRQAQDVSLAHHARLTTFITKSKSLAIKRARAAQSCGGSILTSTYFSLVFKPVFLR